MKIPNFILLHPVELVLIVSSTIITATSFFLYFQNNNFTMANNTKQVLGLTSTNEDVIQKKKVMPHSYFIDVSGAVLNPDLYEVTPGARLKDVIDLAGGFSQDADSFFVGRNFNMSKILSDQEKVYIPFISDITNGRFMEKIRTLEYLSPNQITGENNQIVSSNQDQLLAETDNNESGITLSINTASLEELDTLPGIGPATAQKIIDNRPYSSLDELLSKKAVNTSTFGKMKEFISL